MSKCLVLDRRPPPTSISLLPVTPRINELFPAPVVPITTTTTSGARVSFLRLCAFRKAVASVTCLFCNSRSIDDRRDPTFELRTNPTSILLERTRMIEAREQAGSANSQLCTAEGLFSRGGLTYLRGRRLFGMWIDSCGTSRFGCTNPSYPQPNRQGANFSLWVPDIRL